MQHNEFVKEIKRMPHLQGQSLGKILTILNNDNREANKNKDKNLVYPRIVVSRLDGYILELRDTNDFHFILTPGEVKCLKKSIKKVMKENK